MPKLQVAKSEKNHTETYFLTLPVQLVRAKQWHKHDTISVTINKEGDLILRKVESAT